MDRRFDGLHSHRPQVLPGDRGQASPPTPPVPRQDRAPAPPPPQPHAGRDRQAD